jgi:hypothetical protein
VNLSSRLRVETGDKLMIGGFIVTGNTPKKVVLRGMGPSLAAFSISDFLADPYLELRGSNGGLIRKNDNWKDDQRSEIEGTTFQPPDDHESVIVATLVPGAYTALLTGTGPTPTGIGVVEIYDADVAADSQLANISTRGFVQTQANVLIGGFSLNGSSGTGNVALRGIGPSLAQFGLSNTLADPTLEMHNANGTVMISNDDWLSDPVSAAALTVRGLGLSDPKEAGIFASLAPGQYTVTLAGKNGGIGIGLVEIYKVN